LVAAVVALRHKEQGPDQVAVFEESVMKDLIVRFGRDDEGQDLIEYALLAGFISLAAVAAITAVGLALSALYTVVETNVKAAAS